VVNMNVVMMEIILWKYNTGGIITYCSNMGWTSSVQLVFEYFLFNIIHLFPSWFADFSFVSPQMNILYIHPETCMLFWHTAYYWRIYALHNYWLIYVLGVIS
jgi:hypothetical protein